MPTTSIHVDFDCLFCSSSTELKRYAPYALICHSSSIAAAAAAVGLAWPSSDWWCCGSHHTACFVTINLYNAQHRVYFEKMVYPWVAQHNTAAAAAWVGAESLLQRRGSSVSVPSFFRKKIFQSIDTTFFTRRCGHVPSTKASKNGETSIHYSGHKSFLF